RARGPCSSITSAGRDLTALPRRWRASRSRSTCSISAYAAGTAVRGQAPPAPHAPAPPAPYAPAPPSGLAFDDEFNGTSVNGTLWSVMNQHGDLSNDEPECYMTANTGAQNGMLTETARAQTVNCGD